MAQTDKMLARKDGSVGHLIFNNPERRNAVSLEMWQAATEIIDDFAKDEAIRVVVLSGAGGKAFVSGADISKFEDERATDEAIARYNAAVERANATVYEFPKPTIAMIQGYCIGGGVAASRWLRSAHLPQARASASRPPSSASATAMRASSA